MWTPLEEENNRPIAEINVTPLVDVMLVLMITFMITMPVLTYTIAIRLPSTNIHQLPTAEQNSLHLTIDKQGNYFISRQLVSTDKFASLLHNKIKNKEDPVLAISADEEVDYKYVAKALGIAQEAGVKKVGFVTKHEDSLP